MKFTIEEIKGIAMDLAAPMSGTEDKGYFLPAIDKLISKLEDINIVRSRHIESNNASSRRQEESESLSDETKERIRTYGFTIPNIDQNERDEAKKCEEFGYQCVDKELEGEIRHLWLQLETLQDSEHVYRLRYNKKERIVYAETIFGIDYGAFMGIIHCIIYHELVDKIVIESHNGTRTEISKEIKK